MSLNNHELIDKLEKTHSLDETEYFQLLSNQLQSVEVEYLRQRARIVTDQYFGRNVRIRGLIEITNVCRNDCYYCGLRHSNQSLKRYTLSKDQILDCCRYGYEIGFRTFVLQGGENPSLSVEKVEEIVKLIHCEFPDSAITLSLGEWSDEAFEKFKKAGATRYLLRQESITPDHYGKLHPDFMSLENRIRCLKTLKRLGYQTGTGIMVGSPFQSVEDIVRDLIFMEKLQPEMIGIGPFLPHKDTPFGNYHPGELEMTLKLISILRLMFPHANIPATTALATLHPQGRILGLKAGANVVMPNLTIEDYRNQYSLYNNKVAFGVESAEGLELLKQELGTADLYVTTEKGDFSNV